MRDGYWIKRDTDPSVYLRLMSPTDDVVATVGSMFVDGFAISSEFNEIESQVVSSKSELEKCLAAMADEHYKLITPGWQRFHDWRKGFLRDPIWGWLAFVVASAVAVVGWMS